MLWPGARFSNVLRTFRARKAIRKSTTYVVKRRKTKITAKFRASERLRFEDTKRNMSPEIRPKSFGTFEKQAPGLAVGDTLDRDDLWHPFFISNSIEMNKVDIRKFARSND